MLLTGGWGIADLAIKAYNPLVCLVLYDSDVYKLGIDWFIGFIYHTYHIY